MLFLHRTLPCVKEFSCTIMCCVKKFFLLFVLNLLPGHVTAPRKIGSSEQPFSPHFSCSTADCGDPCSVPPQSYLFQSELLVCLAISLRGCHIILLSPRCSFQLCYSSSEVAWPEWCSIFNEYMLRGFIQCRNGIFCFVLFSLFFC